jgi:hypothetical protein
MHTNRVSPLPPSAHTEAVFNCLKQCAAQMRTVTYGELATASGLAKESLGQALSSIRVGCRARDLPWLNALAVNARTRQPGSGYLPAELRATEVERERHWRAMVLRVYAFDWQEVTLASREDAPERAPEPDG